MFYITPEYVTAITLVLPKAHWKLQLISDVICNFQLENICSANKKNTFLFQLFLVTALRLPFAAKGNLPRHSPIAAGLSPVLGPRITEQILRCHNCCVSDNAKVIYHSRKAPLRAHSRYKHLSN